MFYSKKADSEYQSTNDTLVELLLNRDTLLKAYTPKHPQVVAISNEIIENARKMAILLHLHISDMEDKEIHLRNRLKVVSSRTNALVDEKLEVNRLKRTVESYTSITAHLEQKKQEALIKKAEKPEEISVLRPAFLPAKPINPPRTAATGVLGIIIGVILGMVVAFVVETFDTSLGTIEDIEETLGTQVLGVIPHTDGKAVLERVKDKYPKQVQESCMKQAAYLVSHLAPQSIVAENFRVSRTAIQYKCMEKNIKTVAIASASRQEGKTVTAINLAISMVQAELRVLLIGSDLRKPTLYKVFGIDRAPGLTDILLGNCPWRDAVANFRDMMLAKMMADEDMLAPGLENLHIITSGTVPAYPAEVINSSRLADFIKEAKEAYDIILFDSTPILSTADAAILGAKVDGVLVVHRLGSVSRGLLKRSMTILGQIDCHIMGTILNDMRPELSPDFQGYRYYGDYAYGEEDKYKSRRRHKNGFSFVKEKLSNHRNRIIRSNKDGLQEQGQHNGMLRLPLIGAALALLTASILWQNGDGILRPFRLLEVEESGQEEAIKAFYRKKALDTNATGKPKEITTKTKTAVSVESPRHDTENPATKSQPGEKSAPDLEIDAPARVISSHPFSIHLGSFSSQENAKEAVLRYNRGGLSAYSAKVELKHEVWYRVFTGHFEDREQAERFKQQHRLTRAIVNETRFANLIASYSSLDEVENQILLLKSLEYCPYVIKNDDGQSGRLFVGAFSTKEGAQRQYDDLQSSGIRAKTVKR
jgi:capsular exopolysaccharide synthesis family protein